MTDREFTVEQMLAEAAEARAAGLPGLADIFESIADAIAVHNEHHRHSVQRMREVVGDAAFAAFLTRRAPKEGEAVCLGCHGESILEGPPGEPWVACSYCGGSGVQIQRDHDDTLAVARAEIDQMIAEDDERERVRSEDASVEEGAP